MQFTTTISAAELAEHLNDPEWIIMDSRFKLAYPDQGRIDYEKAHIPGAVYAHLDEDLSGPILKGITGRHPLPSVEKVSKVFANFGIDTKEQVVAYDDMGGALAAGRVWWLLRWLGHETVAVLDGGWQEWVKKGFAVSSGNETHKPQKFVPHPRNELLVDSEEIEAMRKDPDYLVLDARSADRFRGENETIDPVAGHIPGAISAPYAGNLNLDGNFRSNENLAARYKKLLNGVPIHHVVCYCGSGVTATHDILAMMKAGMGEVRLYAGSYSEWITDPNRPVEK
ncbi:MAG: 3-mercaptopyruvate sulfurtransferase [Chloroflexi bacterium RBG_19FT_COMBO_47_9]|nr:MAG: 3-mercaptopyruvate sulfurtransferase [Chloroflexi bacterium RBG_19FT_COMBO_47_9]